MEVETVIVDTAYSGRNDDIRYRFKKNLKPLNEKGE